MNLFDKFRTKNKKNFDDISEDSYVGIDIPSVEEVRNFESNPVWKYISDTIKYRVNSARDDLEDQNADIDTIRVHQGRIEELRFIESLPGFLISQHDNLVAEKEASKAATDNKTTNKEV